MCSPPSIENAPSTIQLMMYGAGLKLQDTPVFELLLRAAALVSKYSCMVVVARNMC